MTHHSHPPTYPPTHLPYPQQATQWVPDVFSIMAWYGLYTWLPLHWDGTTRAQVCRYGGESLRTHPPTYSTYPPTHPTHPIHPLYHLPTQPTYLVFPIRSWGT